MELAFKLFQHVPEADLLDWIFFMRAVTQMASVFPSRCNVTYRAAGTPLTLTVVWFAQKLVIVLLSVIRNTKEKDPPLIVHLFFCYLTTTL